MTKVILLILAFIVTGCAQHPMRTGQIVINKFDIKDYQTNNPLQVKDDVVERLSGDLHKALLKYIPQDSKMTVSKECKEGDFELTGKFEKVDVKIDSHFRLVTIKVTQEFSVDVSGELKKCKTGEVIARFESDKDNEDMKSVIDDLAENVVHKIKKDKSVILTTTL